MAMSTNWPLIAAPRRRGGPSQEDAEYAEEEPKYGVEEVEELGMTIYLGRGNDHSLYQQNQGHNMAPLTTRTIWLRLRDQP